MDTESKMGTRPPTKSWLEDTLRPFNFLTAIRERQYVKRICRECLDLYHQVKIDHPTEAALTRYSMVIAKHTGGDAAAVDTIMQRVEESFATWPIERPVTFRDVVQYLAITDYMNENPEESGVRARVAEVVEALIPANL